MPLTRTLAGADFGRTLRRLQGTVSLRQISSSSGHDAASSRLRRRPWSVGRFPTAVVAVSGCESERGCGALASAAVRETYAGRESQREETTRCSQPRFAGWRRRRLRNCNLTLTPPYASALQQSIRPRILARRRVHPELRAEESPLPLFVHSPPRALLLSLSRG